MRAVRCCLFAFVAFGCAFATPATAQSTRPAVEVAHGKGFTLRAPGNVADINVRLRVQLQGLAQRGGEDEPGMPAAPETSFLLRRLRVLFQGQVLRGALRYYVQLGFAAPDKDLESLVPVRDAWVEWRQIRDLMIRAGQGKVPFTRERIISSSSLALVDRSIVNLELNLDRDVGVTALSQDLFGAGERLRYAVGVFGGDGRNRRARGSGLLWAARFEALPLGPFDDLVQGDFGRTKTPKIALGTAFAYNDDTVRTLSTLGPTIEAGSIDYRHASADALVKWRGAQVFGEVVYRKGSANPDERGALPQPRSAWGWLLQAGYLVHPKLEISGRYAEVRALQADESREREVGGGLSWYLQRHDLKLQLDYFRLLRDSIEPVDRVRLQTQLFF